MLPCNNPKFPHGANKEGYTFCYANLDANYDGIVIGSCDTWCTTNLDSGDGCGGCCGELIEHYCEADRVCYDGQSKRHATEHSSKSAPCNKAEYVKALDATAGVYTNPTADYCETIVPAKTRGVHNDYYGKNWDSQNGGKTCLPPAPVCSSTDGFGLSSMYPCHCGKTTGAKEVCYEDAKEICSATNDNDGKCEARKPVCSNLEGLWSDKYKCHCGKSIEAREVCSDDQVCVATNDKDGECKVPKPVCSNRDGGVSDQYDCHCGKTIAAKTMCSAEKPLCTATDDGDGVCKAQCYQALDTVATDEGADVGSAVVYDSVDGCKEACSVEKDCHSMSVCPAKGKCFMKSKVQSAGVPQSTDQDCKTYFKTPCYEVCSDTNGGVSSGYPCHCGKTTDAKEICQDGHKCTATSDSDGVCKAPDMTCPSSDVGRRRSSKGETGHCRRRSGADQLPPGCYCPKYDPYIKEGDDSQPVVNMLEKTYQAAKTADPSSKWSKHLGRCTVREGANEYELGHYYNDNLPFADVCRLCAEACAGEAKGACTGFDVMVQYGYEQFSQCRIYGSQTKIFVSGGYQWNSDERNDGWPNDVINDADGTTDTFCAAKTP